MPTIYTADYEKTYPNSTDWPGTVLRSGYDGDGIYTSYPVDCRAPLKAPLPGWAFNSLPGPDLGFVGGDADYFGTNAGNTWAEYTYTLTASLRHLDHVTAGLTTPSVDPGVVLTTYTPAEAATGIVVVLTLPVGTTSWGGTTTGNWISVDTGNHGAYGQIFTMYFTGDTDHDASPEFFTCHTHVRWSVSATEHLYVGGVPSTPHVGGGMLHPSHRIGWVIGSVAMVGV